MQRRWLPVLVVTVAAVAISACGSDATTAKTEDAPRTCDAPPAEGKPEVTLPASPAEELGIDDTKTGTGEAVVEHATVSVQYVGCGQLSGKQFDSSWDRGEPTEFNIDEVIPGWTKGLLGMKVGGRRTLTIPGAMAYGANPPSGSGIESDETLVFVIDLVKIKPGPDPKVLEAITARGKPTVAVPDAPATELKIVDDVVGTGDAVVEHATVSVHYVGVGQATGKEFDSSWSRGQPAEFSIDQVIPGWTEGLLGMKVGGRRTLTIPGAKAYGANPPQGSTIQADETLVFVVDLVAIS